MRSGFLLHTYAKANPHKISMASFGSGSASHLAGELFKLMAGVDLVHVPYRGGAAMITDLVGGQVQVGFDVMPTSIPHIRTGALRALGERTPSAMRDCRMFRPSPRPCQATRQGPGPGLVSLRVCRLGFRLIKSTIQVLRQGRQMQGSRPSLS